jgi:anti-sigma factor RsiW
MNHAGEGLLQAYIDGEVTGPAAADLSAHVGACAVCDTELRELRRASEIFHGAMARLDAAAPRAAAPRVPTRVAEPVIDLAGERARRAPALGRFAAGSLARAAALVLLVAGGATAMIPGSPLRRWIGQGLDRIAAVFAQPEVVAPAATPSPAAPVQPTFVPGAEMSIQPANGGVQVYVQASEGDGRLTVRFADAELARVQTDSSAHAVTFRNSTGRMDILNLGVSDAILTLPGSLEHAEVSINGAVVLRKEGDAVRVTGPAVRHTPQEIVFRTGS